MYVIKNGLVLDSENIRFYKSNILVDDNNKILEISNEIKGDYKIIDVDGKYVIPAFIDIHTHGGMGFDFLDASVEEIGEILKYYEKNGTKTVYATTVTASKEVILKAIRNIKEAAKVYKNVTIAGIHIEGPFISTKHPGCHMISEIRKPTTRELDEICEVAGDMKLKITVAPEVDGAEEFIKEAHKRGVNIGIGHTDSDSETVKKAISLGANTMIHTFNAMTGLHHRKPGCVGVALLSDVYTEIISDGYHIHPDVVSITYKVKGTDKLVLVTDSMQAAGMPNGKYSIGGIDVFMEDDVVKTQDGVLAGSTLNLHKAVKNLMSFSGATLGEAVVCATRNPAKAVGIYDEVGSIDVGKRADFIVLDENLDIIDTKINQ